MDPNQPEYQSPQPNPQYDFIMNPVKPPKRSLFKKPPGTPPPSKKTRTLTVVVLGLGIFSVLFILYLLFFSGGDGTRQKLTELAQKQQEIIRIIGIGESKSRDTTTKGFAETTKMTLITQQKNLLDYMKSTGNKVPETKELSGGKDAKNDTALTNGEKSGRFDEAFKKTIQDALQNYQTALKKTYDESDNKKTKQLLSTDYDQVKTLLSITAK